MDTENKMMVTRDMGGWAEKGTGIKNYKLPVIKQVMGI